MLHASTLARRFARALLGLSLVVTSTGAGAANLFVSDGDSILRFDATTGAAVGSPISLESATGLTAGADGLLYAAHTTPQPEVFRFNPSTGAQIGPGPLVTYNGQNDGHDVFNPQGIKVGSGGLYVADVTASDVHRYDTSGGSLGSLTSDELVQPQDVAFDSSGNLYVVNPGSANVLRSAGGTGALTEFFPTQTGGLTIPISLAFSPNGELYVLDIGNGTPAVRRYTFAGAADGTPIVYSGNNLFQPAYLAFGFDGKLYVSGQDLNTGQGEILRYQTDGTLDGAFITGLTNPTFMAFVVPEPAAWVLLIVGTFTFVAAARRSTLLEKTSS